MPVIVKVKMMKRPTEEEKISAYADRKPMPMDVEQEMDIDFEQLNSDIMEMDPKEIKKTYGEDDKALVKEFYSMFKNLVDFAVDNDIVGGDMPEDEKDLGY